MAAIAVTLHGPSFSSFFRFSFLLSTSHDVCVCLVSRNKPSQGDVDISLSLSIVNNWRPWPKNFGLYIQSTKEEFHRFSSIVFLNYYYAIQSSLTTLRASHQIETRTKTSNRRKSRETFVSSFYLLLVKSIHSPAIVKIDLIHRQSNNYGYRNEISSQE